MLLDKLYEFDPAGTLITVTAPSTNVLDLHGATLLPAFSATVLPGRDMGIGASGGVVPRLMIVTQAAFTAAGAATLNLQFQGAPDNGAGVPGAYVTYAETGVIAKATLVNGVRIFDIDWPRVLTTPVAPANLPRFVRLNYVVATGPFQTGSVQAEVVLGRDDQMNYPAGATVAN